MTVKHRVLILERNYTGHRLTGVRVLIDALLDLKQSHDVVESITLATTQAGFESDEFAEQLNGIQDKFLRLALAENNDSTGSGTNGNNRQHKKNDTPMGAALTRLQDWRAHVCSGSFDHVYIPYGDGLLQLLAVAKFIPGFPAPPKQTCVESIFMRGSFGYDFAKTHTRQLALFGLKHAPVQRIHLIDPLPYRFIQTRQPALLSKVHLLPDPITPTRTMDRLEALTALQLDTHCAWIGCVGMIDGRKGADRLINAFVQAELPDNTKLLLAGKHSADVTQLLASHNDSRIISIDRYLSETELNQAISAMTLMATPYPKFIGSASIVLRAAAAERFCIGSNSGWMHYVINEFGLGMTCDVNEQDIFSTSLVLALEKARHYQPLEACRDFVRYGSMPNVYAHWTGQLRERSGIESSSQLLAWPERKEPPIE